MAASSFVNAMQVDFESVLAMEHTGMVRMFKSLEDTGLKGFLEVYNSVFEGAITEFFVNAKVIAGNIVSFVANRKMVVMKDVFGEAFGLPTKGMVGFINLSDHTVVDMRRRFSGSDVPFRAPSKKNEMKMEYRLLHDIVAKALCAKAGSFDMVTSENPRLQSQGFAVRLSVLLERLVKADLGESVKLHLQKVLNNKYVHTYIKKNMNVILVGESSKQTEDTASGTEGGQSQMAKPMEKEVETVVKKQKNRKEKVVPAVKKQKVVVSKPVEARIQAAPVKTQRTKKVKSAAGNQGESQPSPVLENPAAADDASTAGAPEVTMETTPVVARQVDDTPPLLIKKSMWSVVTEQRKRLLPTKISQSCPRPKGRLLRQPALEGLKRSARMDSPRKVGRNKFRRGAAAAARGGHGGGGGLERRAAAKVC
ncbi:hypothetical protein F511_11722 [Dorcoceras hygrometricum]|uniref:Uncharacterized protein n=1 Tax=Dorcoceras hygrometricum TaxID=472368 RepID=A0A2Z7A5R0_9LAMI|nr:hypothetical protein F511_11722 [Dorcoceras hygrometricum]